MQSWKLSPAQLPNLTCGPNTPEQHAAFTHFCGQKQYSSDASFVDTASVVVVGLFTVPTPTEADSHFGGGWCWWRPNLWRDSPLTTAAALSEAPICGRSICVVGWAVGAVNMKAVASKHVDCRRLGSSTPEAELDGRRSLEDGHHQRPIWLRWLGWPVAAAFHSRVSHLIVWWLCFGWMVLLSWWFCFGSVEVGLSLLCVWKRVFTRTSWGKSDWRGHLYSYFLLQQLLFLALLINSVRNKLLQMTILYHSQRFDTMV
jgi:hypothetical protein